MDKKIIYVYTIYRSYMYIYLYISSFVCLHCPNKYIYINKSMNNIIIYEYIIYRSHIYIYTYIYIYICIYIQVALCVFTALSVMLRSTKPAHVPSLGASQSSSIRTRFPGGIASNCATLATPLTLVASPACTCDSPERATTARLAINVDMLL